MKTPKQANLAFKSASPGLKFDVAIVFFAVNMLTQINDHTITTEIKHFYTSIYFRSKYRRMILDIKLACHKLNMRDVENTTLV